MLDVHDNEGITDIGGLSGMTVLQELDVSGCSVADTANNKALGALTGCFALKKLDVSSNAGVTDLGALVGLTLTHLNLSGTGITSIDTLAASKDAQGNDITNQIKGSLAELDISGTKVTRIEGIVTVAGSQVTNLLPSLKKLTAKNLALDSTGTLAEIARATGFTASDYVWDFTGSTFDNMPDWQIAEINTAFADSDGSINTNLKGFPLNHEHTYGTTWEKDETYHWQVCTADGCSMTNGKAEHTFDSGVVTEISLSPRQ